MYSTAKKCFAFEIMMQNSKERTRPKRVHSSGTKALLKYYEVVSIETCASVATYLFVGNTELRGNHLVRNKWAGGIEGRMDVVYSIILLEKSVEQLTSTLDSHHQKFSSRSIHLPKEFSSFKDLITGTEKKKISSLALNFNVGIFHKKGDYTQVVTVMLTVNHCLIW